MLIKAISKLCVFVLALTCTLLHPLSYADDNPYSLCSDGSVTKSSQQVVPLDPNTPAEFTADHAKRDENGIATLEGTVQMTRGTQKVDAEKLEYDENNKNVVASGNG